MSDDTDDARRRGRFFAGHTEQLALRMHPDLYQHIHDAAKARYITPSEYVRMLIIADMESST